MADNVVANAGAGGATFATDDVGGVHYPISKVAFGAFDTATLVTSSVGLPVDVKNATLAVTQSGTWNITNVSGTVSLPTGASTEASLAKLTITQGTALGSNTQALAGASVTTSAPTYTTGQISPLSLDTAGNLRALASQSGTWNITNVSGTVSLPTGASTAAKQPALGTAGSASADVITVQGVASMTALLVNGSAVTQPISAASLPLPTGASTEASLAKLTVAQGAALGSNTQALAGGSVTTSAPTYTTGQISPLSLDTGGLLRASATQVGTWNIGTVTTVTTVSSVTTLPARVATADSITAKIATDTIQNGLTALTPKFAVIAVSGSGDTTVVALVASKKIRVLRWYVSSSGTVNAKWKSSTTSDLTGLHYMVVNSGAGGSFCPVGLFETVAGEALTLNLSGAVAVGGNLTYVEV